MPTSPRLRLPTREADATVAPRPRKYCPERPVRTQLAPCPCPRPDEQLPPPARPAGLNIRTEPPDPINMARHWYFYVSRVFRDMQGGEVLEYAMLAGLFVVATIAVVGAVGG